MQAMREFSRVEAIVPFSVRLLDKDEVNLLKARAFGDVSFYSSRPVEEPADRGTAEWLKFLNQKLDFLISLISMNSQGFSSLPLSKVNISGGGLSFLSDQVYQKSDILEIKIVLENPNPVALYLYGEVVACEPKESQNLIRLKFINIDEDVRDQIIKFVFHRQRQIIRQKRET